MDYAALKAELAKPAYQGLTDEQAAAAVLAKTIAVPQTVPLRDVRAVLYRRGAWPAIVRKANAARNGTDVSDGALVCQTIYDLANAGAVADMADGGTAAEVAADLSLLIADGVLKQNDVDMLMALSSKSKSWADATLGSQATDYDISVARKP